MFQFFEKKEPENQFDLMKKPAPWSVLFMRSWREQ